MSFFMFVGVSVNKTICTTGCDSRRENPFSFVSGPFAGFFADAEGLDGSRCQGSLRGLRQFILGFTAAGVVLFARTTTTATPAAAVRVRSVMTRSTSGTTPVKLSAVAGAIIISGGAVVAVSTTRRARRGVPIGIIIVVIRTVRTWSPGRTFLHG